MDCSGAAGLGGSNRGLGGAGWAGLVGWLGSGPGGLICLALKWKLVYRTWKGCVPTGNEIGFRMANSRKQVLCISLLRV